MDNKSSKDDGLRDCYRYLRSERLRLSSHSFPKPGSPSRLNVRWKVIYMSFSRPLRAIIAAGVSAGLSALLFLSSYNNLHRMQFSQMPTVSMRSGTHNFLLKNTDSDGCVGWFRYQLIREDGFQLSSALQINAQIGEIFIPNHLQVSLTFNSLKQLAGGIIKARIAKNTFDVHIQGVELVHLAVSAILLGEELTRDVSLQGPIELRQTGKDSWALYFRNWKEWDNVIRPLSKKLSLQQDPSLVQIDSIGEQDADALRQECEEVGIEPVILDDFLEKIFMFIQKGRL